MTEPYRGAQGSGSQGSIVTERSWVSSHGFHDDRSPGGADPPLSRGGGPVAEINFEFVRGGVGGGTTKNLYVRRRNGEEIDENRGHLADFVG